MTQPNDTSFTQTPAIATSNAVSSTVSLTNFDHLQVRKDLEPHIEQSIEKRLKKYATWFGTSIVLIVVGALIATIWQLNSAVYQAVGKQSENGLYSEVLKMKVQQLEKENAQQKKILDCFNNPQLKDKRGCSYGN